MFENTSHPIRPCTHRRRRLARATVRSTFLALAAAAALPAAHASAATDVLSTEGEQFAPDAGVTTFVASSASASGGKALGIATTGAARVSVSLGQAASRVVLRLRGDQCQGAPRASLAIDGASVGSVDVSTTTYADFAMTRALTAAQHTVAVTFSNDHTKHNCDRTLYFDKVTFVQDATATAPAPAPNQTASATVTCGFGTFGVDAWPTACWRSFADSSPFNTPVPATAAADAQSAAIVSRILGFGPADNLVAGTSGTTSDWSHPIYYPKSSDPLFTLDCTEAWGTCPVEGMQVRIPDAARAAGGSDHHMAVVDQSTGWEYDMWGVTSKPSGGGVLQFRWGGRTRIDGDGRNSDATAARFALTAGVIRAQELEAGKIDHALFMTVKCDSGGYVYPATKAGAKCSDTTNAPPMGTRVQLNMTASQIDALSVPAWKKTILKAMATYGMYFGDTGGGAWGIQAESGATYTSFGREDKMVAFARNNGVTLYNGTYVFNIRDGVDWARYLRVIKPCTTQGTC